MRMGDPVHRLVKSLEIGILGAYNPEEHVRLRIPLNVALDCFGAAYATEACPWHHYAMQELGTEYGVQSINHD